MKTKSRILSVALASGLGLLCMGSVQAADAGNSATTKCHMSFKLSGWSAIYKTASGSGTVTCADGKSMPVTLSAKGGGLTFGKYKIDDGNGDFTGVTSIHDVLGSYATAEAHAGAANSAHGAVMTKGNVTLALSGTGHGWDIGVGFSGFTITAANSDANGMSK